MAQYTISGHTLEFVDDYETLRVKDSSGNTVEDFPLSTTHLKIGVDSSTVYWEITEESPVENAKKHKYDTLGSTTLSFSAPSGNARLGGIGLIDLRDIGKTGNFTTTYYIDACPVYVTYQGGNRATHVEFNGSGCYEYTENE